MLFGQFSPTAFETAQVQIYVRRIVGRRALSVLLAAKEKKYVRRVLVVATDSPKPMRVVPRTELCAITSNASQAASAGKWPDGRWLGPAWYCRLRSCCLIGERY